MAEGKSSDLGERIKAFTLRVIKLAAALPDSALGRIVQHQLLKAGTSAGANYRAAKRAKSRADFISKMGIVEEETDESMYWMELIGDAGLLDWSLLRDLHGEAQEILAMVVASIKTAKGSK
jgi:four helix bundle protein